MTTEDYARSRFQWPVAKTELLRELWARVPMLSATKIALRLGITRCAVLGKRKRMGLPQREPGSHGPATGDSLRPSKRGRSKRGPEAVQPDPYQRPSLPARGPIQDKIGMVELPPDHSECAVDIFELTATSCRWPLGLAPDMMTYCGAKAFPGLPYCSRHACRAYRPGRAG